jgi:hypothetical protein
MMLLNKKTLTLLLLVLGQSHGLNIPNMDVVMRGGDSIEEMHENEFPKYRNGTCTIRFSKDGNFATKNGFFTRGWDANQNSACQVANATKMTYKLQRDGNFVAYCGYNLDYSTRTHQGRTGNFFMGIDDSCILHIYEGTIDCDAINVLEEVWVNIRNEPLHDGDRLGKGEMVRHDGTTLVLQSSDGNLVLYGSSLYDNALWGANQEWDAPPASNLKDFYAKITDSGWLKLVGIDLQTGADTVYFRKNLHSNGASCFTVEYDSVEDDLVAVPCDNARRNRQLRGSTMEE